VVLAVITGGVEGFEDWSGASFSLQATPKKQTPKKMQPKSFMA
jgi:hypothetical protein